MNNIIETISKYSLFDLFIFALCLFVIFQIFFSKHAIYPLYKKKIREPLNIGKAFKKLGKKIASVGKQVVNATKEAVIDPIKTAVIDPVENAFNEVGDGITSVVGNVNNTFNQVKNTADLIKTRLKGGIYKIGPVLAENGIGAIAPIQGVFNDFQVGVTGTMDATNKSFNAIKDTTNSLKGQITGGFNQLGGHITNVTKQAIGPMRGLFNDIENGVNASINETTRSFNAVKDTTNVLKGQITGGFNQLGGHIKSGIDQTIGPIEKTFNDVKSGSINTFNKASEGFNEIMRKSKDALGKINDIIKSLERNTKHMLSVINNGFNMIEKGSNMLIGKLDNTFNDILKNVIEPFKKIEKTFIDLFNKIKSEVTKLIDIVRKALNDIKKQIFGIFREIESTFNDILDILNSIPRRLRNIERGFKISMDAIGMELDNLGKGLGSGFISTFDLIGEGGKTAIGALECGVEKIEWFAPCFPVYLFDMFIYFNKLMFKSIMNAAELYFGFKENYGLNYRVILDYMEDFLQRMDDYAYSFSGVHFMQYPEFILNNCYRCKQLNDSKLKEKSNRVNYVFNRRIPQLLNEPVYKFKEAEREFNRAFT